MPKRLLTVLYPGFAEWEVTFPLFCVHPAIEAQYVSLEERRVRGAMGFEIEARQRLADVEPGDFAGIYLPGGLDPKTKSFPRDLGAHEGLVNLLREFDRCEKIVAAICGAPLVLGAAGLLDGKRFACDVTEDTRGWFDRGHRFDGTWTVDGHILTGSLRGLLPFSIALARLLGEERTARDIGEFLDRKI
jgi:4-methyl-5(b-hydroxyethyl)-thiazole monophosphate biosynthesis